VTSKMSNLSALSVVDESSFVANLEDLRDVDSKTNWVLIEYEGRDTVKVTQKGEDGLDGFKKHLGEDKVQFGMIEAIVTGDNDYNTTKYVLITWIGPKVKAGLQKARCAGHRRELRETIHATVAVAAEMQAEEYDELTADLLGQAISRMRGKYHQATTASSQRKARSSGRGGSSVFQVVDEDKAIEALEQLNSGKADWAIFAYVVGKKGEIELIKTGSGGVESLAAEWPKDRIFFAICKVVWVQADTEALTKWVVISLVGESVSPIAKARTAAQMKEVSEWIAQYTPFHGIFQPFETDDLKPENILAKFK